MPVFCRDRQSSRRPIRSARHRTVPEPLELRQLLSAAPSPAPEGTWQILGGRRADAIVIDVSPDDPALLRATIGGKVVGTRPASSVGRLEVLAGGGNDQVTISLGGDAGGVAVHVDGGKGRDRISGGDGDEELDGGAGADVINGGGGNDHVVGGPGNDDLSGGGGADRISGGRGRDTVHRQGGVDTAARDRRDAVSADASAATLTRLTTDEALRQWLVDAAVRQYQWAFDQPAWGYQWRAGLDGSVFTVSAPPGTVEAGGGPGAAGGGATGGPTSAPAPEAAAGGSVGDGFSKTNVQEEGVDEADLVETDGQFIYTLRSAPNLIQLPPPLGGVTYGSALRPGTQLVIAGALPADAMSVASRMSVDGMPVGMYLVGTRLAVVTQSYPSLVALDATVGAPIRFVGGPGGSAIIDPGDPNVKVTVFDVSDAAAPKVVEETTFDGSYDSSRAVGDRVYVVLRNDTWAAAPKTVDDGNGGQVYESEASYRERLASVPLSDLLPTYDAKAGDSESSGALVAAPDVYVKEVDAPTCGQNMTTVAVLSVADDAAGPLDTTTVAGFAATTYASAHALYLASPFWDPGETAADPARSGTNLFKFDFSGDSVPLAATGEVEGSVFGQFSMDEEGTDFRVATTTDSAAPPVVVDPTTTPPPPQPPVSSNGVYVLRQDGDQLKVVGSVTKLGLTERIQSARFVGDMAYLVTFRRIDPLFAIDLRDPIHPKVAGELKIPGFSSYLQALSDNLLLGIGRDADETGRVTGLQLSLFDVSNPVKPVRLAAQSFGDESTWQWSEAEHNHLAVSYFPEQHALAIPVFSSAHPFALEVFRVGREEGIQPLGTIASDDAISRSLRIGSTLYAVAPNTIIAAQLDTPQTVLGTLSLIGPGEDTSGGVTGGGSGGGSAGATGGGTATGSGTATGVPQAG